MNNHLKTEIQYLKESISFGLENFFKSSNNLEPEDILKKLKILRKKRKELEEKMAEIKYDKKYYIYLDHLRESGVTNMFGAAPYIQSAFNLSKKEARDILADWMETFEERSK